MNSARPRIEAGTQPERRRQGAFPIWIEAIKSGYSPYDDRARMVEDAVVPEFRAVPKSANGRIEVRISALQRPHALPNPGYGTISSR